MQKFLYLIKQLSTTSYTLHVAFTHIITFTSSAVLLLFYVLLCISTPYVEAKVESTKHNLSTTGPGPIKAYDETQICIFCHTPHGAVATPLWNHTLSNASYILPTAIPGGAWETMESTPNRIDGDSRLCLGCHDGTVAIGSVVNPGITSLTPIDMTDSGTGKLTPEGKLAPKPPSQEQSWMVRGTNLSGHHPVSIKLDAVLKDLKDSQCDAGTTSFRVCCPKPPIILRQTGTAEWGVQCSSCHDAHADTIYFLREVYGGTPWDINTYPLCMKCHELCGDQNTTCSEGAGECLPR